MRTFSTAVLFLLACATGIRGQGLGSFDTFTDSSCSEGGEGITVEDQNASGTLPSDVHSVKAYIPDCAHFNSPVVIWVNGGGWYPLVIRPGDSECTELHGPGREWNISC
ncbi:cap domain [Trichoderma arundinaceum]|uniref:Cap domain n=1 Tax=Trichoderma arundinaceum TaxID=490622 RepID=A0A395NCN4_TRIAR|nr:cap domain [Trichoderma arundinaceum]